MRGHSAPRLELPGFQGTPSQPGLDELGCLLAEAPYNLPPQWPGEVMSQGGCYPRHGGIKDIQS